MNNNTPQQATGASKTTRFFVPKFRLRRVPQASYAQPKERIPTWAKEIPIHGRGSVPAARNPIPKPHKRQNQTIRKNNTIPQLNFHSSWGLAPEVLHPQPIGLLTNPLKSHRRQRRIPTYIRPPAELNPKGTAQIVS